MKKLLLTAASACLTAALAFPQSPAKVTSGGSDIYGYLVYTENDDASLGLYELTKSGARLSWAAPLRKYDINNGWLKDGKICGFGVDEYYGRINGLNYMEVDFSSGTLLTQMEMSTEGLYYTVCTYSPADNMIYGYGKVSTTQWAFMKSPARTPWDIEVVKNVAATEKCLSMCYCPVDGKIYAVRDGLSYDFVTITPEGTQTVVMPITQSDDLSEYVTGLVYSPVEDLFYWNRYEGWDDFRSYLSTIDLNARKVTNVRTYSNVEQFSFFVTLDLYSIAGQPAAPSISSLDFTGASLSGTMTLTMPALDVDGQALSGQLTYNVLVDDQSTATGQATPGQSITISLTDLTQGNHTFAATVASGDIISEQAFVNRYIGNDTPKTPANVTLSDSGLTWEAVTEGINGGYLDLSAMQYSVSVNGVEKGTTTSTSMGGLVDTTSPLNYYTASVTAICSGMSSEPGVSNRLLAGTSLQLPVNLVPTKDEFALMKTIDADGDSYSWKSRDGYMESQWSLSKNGGDDWVIIAPIAFTDASAIYSIAFDVMRNPEQTDREHLQVYLGNAAEISAMTQTIIDNFEPLASWNRIENVFEVPAAGTYYIAFRATSLKYEVGIPTGMRVRDIVISRSGIGQTSPGAVTDLSATRAPMGQLSADVSFRLPSLTYNGEPLSSDTQVTATVTAAETKSVTGLPGQEMSLQIGTNQGQNVISVVTSIGETEGTPATTEVYTGVVVPGMVNDLEMVISESMGTVTLTWNAPDTENSLGYVNPETVVYEIYEPVQSFYEIIWNKLGETSGNDRSFAYTPDHEGQKVHTLCVRSGNVAGWCEDMPGGEVLLGTPYPLPMFEDFENGYDHFNYNPWVQYRPEENFTGNWAVWPGENVVTDGEGSMLVCYPKEANSMACIGMPGFAAAATEDANTTILKMQALLSPNAPVTEIRAIASNHQEEILVGTILPGQNSFMTPLMFVLPEEIANAEWIQLYFYADFSSSTERLVLDDISVEKGFDSGIGIIEAESLTDVYTMDGVCVARGVRSDSLPALAKGLYILRTSASSRKLLVP